MSSQYQPYDVMPGDKVNPGDPVTVDRYTTAARINHWITATSLVLLAVSGLSLFSPSLYFLTGLFGGGQITRMIHPWIGVVLFFSFCGLFIRFWRLNLWERNDSIWLTRIRYALAAHDEDLPELGKYNAGQKIMFWSMSALIIVLITSGLVIWDLKKRKKVYEDSWSDWEGFQDHSLVYWTETGEATPDNCPELEEWTSNGLGGAIETKVILDLSSFRLSRTEETRCSPRQ